MPELDTFKKPRLLNTGDLIFCGKDGGWRYHSPLITDVPFFSNAIWTVYGDQDFMDNLCNSSKMQHVDAIIFLRIIGTKITGKCVPVDLIQSLLSEIQQLKKTESSDESIFCGTYLSNRLRIIIKPLKKIYKNYYRNFMVDIVFATEKELIIM